MTTPVASRDNAVQARHGALLDVSGLQVEFTTDHGHVQAVRGVDLYVNQGEVLGLVGESGCGKSATALAIMGLLPRGVGKITGGEVRFKGQDIAGASERKLRRLRGSDLGMIFQDPMTSLNPAFTVSNQISEPLRLHRGLNRDQAHRRSVELLADVGIPNPERVADDYPHKLSGGMRQRVMIAMAMSCEPKLLIADEATTALDVTIQAQIIELLQEIQSKTGMAMLFISHDLGVVAQISDRVSVMYAGRVVEDASTAELFRSPSHPYTQGLLGSIPRLGDRRDRLDPIEGQVPAPDNLPRGCAFAPRCRYVEDECVVSEPGLIELPRQHRSRCWFAPEIRRKG